MTRFSVLDAELSLSALRTIVNVDISMFADTDFISLALPDFPGTDIDLASTFLEMTSEEDGNFAEGPTDSLGFNQCVPALTAVDGDIEARWPISLLTTIDRSAIAAVRLRIVSTSDCTLKATELRALSADWTYAPVDIDNLHNYVHRPPSSGGRNAHRLPHRLAGK